MIAPKPLFGRRPQPPTVRTRRVNSLTIAAGFRFAKGIVLCADTQFTAPGLTKTSGTKIFRREFQFADGVASQIAFTFSGAPSDYALMAIDWMWVAVGNISPDAWTAANLKAELGKVIEEFYARHMYPHPHYGGVGGPALELIVAFRSHITGVLTLLRTNETVLVEMTEHCSIGNGTLLSDYLIPTLYRHGNMSLNDVAIIAAHVLYQTKQYVDGCGGGSEFLVLHADGKFGQVQWYDIDSGERLSRVCDLVLRNLMLDASNPAASDEHLRSVIEDVYLIAQAFRDEKRAHEGGLAHSLSI